MLFRLFLIDLSVWEASLRLCEFLKSIDKSKVSLQNKNVIELGAGIGIPGISAALLGANCLLTEQKPLFSLLQINVDSIFDSQLSNQTFSHKIAKPKTAELDWSDKSTFDECLEVFDEPIDIILVSDCIFQQVYGESWRDLAYCLQFFLSRSQSRDSDKSALVYNAVERRNEGDTSDGVPEFLELCTSLGIKSKLVKRTQTGESDKSAADDPSFIEIYEQSLETSVPKTSFA